MAFIDAAAIPSAPAAPATAVSDDRRRRLLVHCVYLLFVMLLLEGSIRKWALPQFAQYIYFLRDPVVLLTYLLAIRNGAFRPLHPLLAVGMAFAVIMIPITAVQLANGTTPALLLFAAYGWRNYFLYLPLPFIIATQFRRRDLDRFCGLAILALIAAAPLATMQFLASPDAPINVGSSDDVGLQFQNLRSANGHIRPAGPFTSILGMVELTASTAAFVLTCWILPRRERPVPRLLMLGGAVAVAASLAVSGSRTMFLQVGLVVAAAVASGTLMRRASMFARTTTLPLLLVAAFVVLFPLVFREGFDTIASRWQEASQAEQGGAVGRFVAEILDFVRVVGDVPVTGYGLGLGGNAAMILGITSGGSSPIPYVETDWARHMVDLGSVLGILFIVYRFAFVIWLGRAAARGTIRSADPLAMLLFGYVGIVLLQAQISGNGVVNAFCWLYVGLCMAACRTGAAGPDGADSAPAPARPRNVMA
jgi:hypothetical protein